MSRLNNPHYEAALAIARRLRELGHSAYFAGGCVRDLLLGAEPHDFDVATSATPQQVQAAFPRTESVGAHFGVVLVIETVGSERTATEVATFRSDGAYSDGRRPDAVQFSLDPREDVLRRDFTINGLLLDALAYDEGGALRDCVLDFVGGQIDLQQKLVRAIGDAPARFAEDKLRMLRAMRFAARLGFAIEHRTMAAMQAQAAGIAQVSAERVREELTKILTEGAARRGFELLDESGLLREALPEIARLHGVEQPPQYHPEGDVWTHTLMLLEHLPKGASATLAWGMLLHDVGKPATFTPPDPAKIDDRIRFNGHVEVGVAVARAVLNRLRFSNEDCAQVLALVKHHMQFGDVMKMKQSTLKRFLRLPKFEEHLALHRADCLSSHGKLEMYEFAKRHLEELGEEQIRPRLLIAGDDLVAAGYKPGPAFKAMIEAAEDAQLEGAIATKEAGLRLLEERFGPPPRDLAAQVLVLGAGIAGLTAARALAERGVRVMVLEARDRVGGRLLSRRVEGGGVVELGAEFVHGRAPELWALIDEAGVTTAERDGTMLREEHSGGVVEDGPQDDGFFEALEKLEDFKGEDRTFADWLAGSDVPREERRALLGYVEGFNAADARRIGVQALGAQQKAEGSIEGDRAWHVRGGYARLAEFLAARIKELGGEVRLSCEVRRMNWRARLVDVRTSVGAFHAKRCIVALPLGVLQAGFAIEPEPRAMAAARRLEMGHAVRFTMVFRERWWTRSPVLEKGKLEAMSFLFTSQRLPTVWWTAHPEPEALPALTGWVGGPRAKELAGKGADELGRDACAALAEIFKVDASEVRAQLVETCMHDWSGDPFARGAYSYVPAGAIEAPEAMTRPEAGTLFFAGEHTDVTGHWGTVHAAIRSGLRAAAQALDEDIARC